MDADANVPIWFVFFEFLFFSVAHEGLNFDGGLDDVDGMALVGGRYAAGTHVAVTDGFEFFDVELLRNAVEVRETEVEFFYEFLWAEFAGDAGEVFEVGKHDGHAFVINGHDFVLLFEFFGDVGGQDVEQEVV